MNKYVSQVIVLCLVIANNLNAQKFQFTAHEIGRHGYRMGQTALVDIDRDGDLDWVYGERGTMFWFEFQAANKWIRHELGIGASTDVGGCPVDINRDGLTDFMAGTGWYENTGNSVKRGFILHGEIKTMSCHDNIAVDIDGDGVKDIVAMSNNPSRPDLVWYKIPEDPEKKWEGIRIGDGIHGGISHAGYGDLDNDGDMDIARGNAWFENVDGKGKEWNEHEVLIPRRGNRPYWFGLALKSWVLDLDQDGDPDIIEAEADVDDGRIFWFENRDNAKEWKFHAISEDHTNQDFHTLAVADFDNDGDPDVFSGGGPLTPDKKFKMFIWENKNGDGSAWEEHLILEGKMSHEAVAGDVDGDGDIDICTKPWNGSLHIFLENKLIK